MARWHYKIHIDLGPRTETSATVQPTALNDKTVKLKNGVTVGYIQLAQWIEYEIREQLINTELPIQEVAE